LLSTLFDSGLGFPSSLTNPPRKVRSCPNYFSSPGQFYFQAKSRETGVFMALGASRRQLRYLLFRDLTMISVGACLVGMALGTPLAWGIWQLFRLFIVDTAEMIFSVSWKGYLWSAAFSLFSVLMLFCMGARFIRRTNIIDVVNEQRKSEPIRDVKSWYGWVGILLMAVGGFGGYIMPSVFIVRLSLQPPFWCNFIYLLLLVGLYLFLVYTIVHGWGGKNRYKHIITRSMMKFQGRQTVRNMCVITLLIAGAYFAMFYVPALAVGSLLEFNERPYDYLFHYRVDENMVTQSEIEEMADEEGVTITSWDEIGFLNLATDGYSREWMKDGTISNDYEEFFGEASFVSESDFNRLSGQSVDVQPGHYVFIRTEGDSDSIYDYYAQITKLTNPVNMHVLDTAYQEDALFSPLYHYFVLDDGDYASLDAGLTDEWRENMVLFNVVNVDETYVFAKRLKNAIIDHCTKKSAVFSGYDRIEKRNANEQGEEYRADIDQDMQVDYAKRDSSEFYLYWEYTPQFRVLDKNDFVLNLAVFLMLFVFIAIICFAAVLVIAYTRCLTIALNNRQVYDDLRYLGANRSYLYASVRSQISKVFAVPAVIGSVVMFIFYTMIMYFNSNSLTSGEVAGLGVNLVLIAVMSIILWCIYRFTLHKVCRMLGIHYSHNGKME
ncbi:MAG: FtsX-like permease family protein, partial [Desulfitobacteriaceae bacterium]